MYTKLKQFGKVKTNEPLSKHTTFKIGGPADFFITIVDVGVLVDLLQFLDSENINYIILGGGSNMLARDEGFDGVVVKIKDTRSTITDDSIEASSGCVSVHIAHESVKAGLTGFEWGVGVPGTIGGAVRGNAGAMGGEMKDVVEKVEAYRNGEIVEYSSQECAFGYRDSIFKHDGGVVLRVWLKLKKGESSEGMREALRHLAYRNKTQPIGHASTGCIFKNVDAEKYKEQLLKHFSKGDAKVSQFLRVGHISAGWLVEEAGMKGVKIGEAQVSERHGNFIVNLGGASASDVALLIEKIKEKVYTMFEVELEEEIHKEA